MTVITLHDASHSIVSEAQAWCRANWFKPDVMNWPRHDGSMNTTFSFKCANQAMLFKLTWGGK